MHLDQLGSLRLAENKESLVQEDLNLPDCLSDQSLAQRLRERTLPDPWRTVRVFPLPYFRLWLVLVRDWIWETQLAVGPGRDHFTKTSNLPGYG